MRAWKLAVDTSSIFELSIMLFKLLFFLHYSINVMRVCLSFCKHSVTTWSFKKFNYFAFVKDNVMPHGIFVWLWISNKCMEFHMKILNGCWENGKKTLGGLFAAECILIEIIQIVNNVNVARYTRITQINACIKSILYSDEEAKIYSRRRIFLVAESSGLARKKFWAEQKNCRVQRPAGIRVV